MRAKKSNNILFKFFIIQIFIYALFVPLSRYVGNATYFKNYPFIIFCVLTIFLPSYTLTYFYFSKTRNEIKKKVYVNINHGVLNKYFGLVFFIFAYSLPFLFVQISLDYNILYRRVGNQYLSEIFTTIPFYQKIVIKLFTQFQSFWIGGLIYIYYLIKSLKLKSLWSFKLLLLINIIFVFLYDLINSRLDLILLIVTLIVLNNYFSLEKFKIITRKNLLVLFVSLYSIFVVISLRKTFFAGKDVTLSQFSPIEVFSSTEQDDIENDFIIRLDGIEIINLVFNKYNYGVMTDLGLLKNNIFISFFPNSSYGSTKRLNSETTIKVEMLNKYASIQELDYNASMLTDLFGTLGLFGFLFGGSLLGFIIFKIDFILTNYSQYNANIVFFILFLYSIVISFEMPFWGVVFSPIRFFPFFLGVLFIYKRVLAFFSVQDSNLFRFLRSNRRF